MKILRNITLILTLLSASQSYAQEVIQKASKIVEKEYDENIQQVQIRGEKASIVVSGWNKDYISVIIKPISKNVSKNEAVSDLKFIQYSSEIEGTQLIIKNSFHGNYERISSNLSVEIELKIPHKLPLNISNLYGPVSVSNLSNVQLDVAYGRIDMSDISGYSTVKSRYSNIALNKVLGSLNIEAEKSDIRGNGLDATTTISSKYGIIELDISSKKYSTAISAYRSEVKINLENVEDFNYKLSTTNGAIIYPHQTESKREKLDIQHSEKNKNIEISTTYSDITISAKNKTYAKE